MNNLLIIRVTQNRFTFSLDGGEPISDSNPRLFTNGDFCDFKTSNGSNIISKQRILFSDIIVRDTFGGTGDFSFLTVSSLWLKLVELEFFNGVTSGTSGTGVSRFNNLDDTFQYFGNNGKVPVVNESQSKLEPKEFFNISKFTELSDVEISTLIQGKVVGVDFINGQLKFVLTDAQSAGVVNGFSATGFANYDNSLVLQNYTTVDLPLKLLNDGLGANTKLDFMPFGITQLWDSVTNTLDFSELSVGDTCVISIDADIITTVVNQECEIFIIFNEGLADEFTINLSSKQLYKSIGANKFSDSAQLYIGSDNIKDLPHTIYFKSDANADIDVNNLLLTVIRKSINIVDFRIDADNINVPFVGATGAIVSIVKPYDRVLLFIDGTFGVLDVDYTLLGSNVTVIRTISQGNHTLTGIGFFIEGVQANKNEITANTDANGVTTLTQFDTIKATLSKVGQTGEFSDLKNNIGVSYVKIDVPANILSNLVIWVNTQNPVLVVSETQIPLFSINEGIYAFINKAKGSYGVGQTQVVAEDFVKILDKKIITGALASTSIFERDDGNVIENVHPSLSTDLTVPSHATNPLRVGFTTTLLPTSKGFNIFPEMGVTVINKRQLAKGEVVDLMKIGTDTWMLQRIRPIVLSDENNTTTFDLTENRLYESVLGARTANTATSYTFVPGQIGNANRRLINAATKPVLAAATEIAGSDFVANTDMYMVVFRGSRVEYWFEKI